MRALIPALICVITTTTALLSPTVGSAQFAPAIVVNDSVVSEFEIDQRIAMLRAFRTPGNLEQTARDQLVEDRLKLEALNAAGLSISNESLTSAMAEFAGRANLELDQFLTLLNQSGVAEETFRDFVRVNVSWRDYIRNRYSNRAQVSEADIDQALGQSGGASSIEVLLSEIIIPAPPPRAQAAIATANRIAQTTSTATFEAEARRVSALPSRANGGRLDWLPIANYPAALRGLLLDLAPGEVTAPIPITNGVALFQMRGVREVPSPAVEAAAIEYAAFYIAGGLSDRGLAEARRVDARVDTCDDLYGIARGLPEEQLQRDVLPPSDIPQDVAMELAKLDVGETSYVLTRSDGETLVFLMMCGRTPVLGEGVDRETIRNQIQTQRLTTYADALLADLRAAANISYP
ncbi:peptidylprolyl isomerase [Octadecabacter sp. 1_MG-2023]|uniref:peptidylprolyl isomerase n=1 Tax=unclassified Octadecabacter TaxID=196158 RepID=UPI001C08F183|nr:MULTISPECIES: peptidylprolyl isomerase [unclassified Octadecabacter]MBU2993596.1 peptidylprolyl isomerase [Octadecabacter sp. B2R22]MDO6735560.1 peptidylprolyl isomerase [Octadecabacter sp. 1_MG-2023]